MLFHNYFNYLKHFEIKLLNRKLHCQKNSFFNIKLIIEITLKKYKN